MLQDPSLHNLQKIKETNKNECFKQKLDTIHPQSIATLTLQKRELFPLFL